MFFPGKPLDDLVADRMLKALEPAALEISILAANDLEAEHRRLDDNWKQRLERSRFEVERRGGSIGPLNRETDSSLVNWNDNGKNPSASCIHLNRSMHDVR